jgi:hypothetical protein
MRARPSKRQTIQKTTTHISLPNELNVGSVVDGSPAQKIMC